MQTKQLPLNATPEYVEQMAQGWKRTRQRMQRVISHSNYRYGARYNETLGKLSRHLQTELTHYNTEFHRLGKMLGIDTNPTVYNGGDAARFMEELKTIRFTFGQSSHGQSRST